MKKTHHKNKLAVVTTGGSGGHIFPAESISAALIQKGFDVVFVTDKRGSNFRVLQGVQTYRLMAEHIMGRSLWGKIKGAFKLYCGAVQALFLLRKLKPDVVVGVGGYASLPAVLAAHMWRMPVVLHEQNAVLGRANRLLAKNAYLILTAFQPTLRSPANVRNVWVGQPVRPAVLEKEHTPYPDRRKIFNLFIFGGSQGAHFFTHKVPEALFMLPDTLKSKISVTAQVRPEDMEYAQKIYSEQGFHSVTLKSFFDNMPDLIAQSHLIIGRAGASTIAEAEIVGRPAILIPLPTSADNHQLENARQFCDAGAGWLVTEDNWNAEKFAHRLEKLIQDKEMLEHAASESYRLAKPNVSEQIAVLIDDIVKGVQK